MKVEGVVGSGTQPLGYIFGIGQGRTQGDDADVALDLRGNVPHSGAENLQNRLEKKTKTKHYFHVLIGLEKENGLQRYI